MEGSRETKQIVSLTWFDEASASIFILSQINLWSPFLFSEFTMGFVFDHLRLIIWLLLSFYIIIIIIIILSI